MKVNWNRSLIFLCGLGMIGGQPVWAVSNPVMPSKDSVKNETTAPRASGVSTIVLNNDLPLGKTAALEKQTKPTKIAIVDLDLILHESKVAQYIQQYSDQERAKFKQEAEKFEAKLRVEDDQLKQLQAKESTKPEEFKQKRAEFESHVSEVKRQLNTKGRSLEESFNKARSDVIQKLMQILTAQAEKNGYTIILPKNVVLLRDPAFDITRDLLEELNQKMPTVDITLKADRPGKPNA